MKTVKISRLDKVNPITGLTIRQMKIMSEGELAKSGIVRFKKVSA